MGRLLRLLWVTVLSSFSFAQSSEVILDTSFEEYSVGTLPSGFRIKYNGMGNSYQVVTDKKSYSGEKSFQVWGTHYWCANIYYDFDVFKHKYVEVQWKMFTTDDNNGWIAFINENGAPWGWAYCGVGFSPKDGTFSICYYNKEKNKNECIYVDKTKIPVKPYEWNDVKVILNTETTECTAFLNGHKLYESRIDFDNEQTITTFYFLNGTSQTYYYRISNPNAFYGLHGIRLGDCPAEGWGDDTDPTYFDDLKIVGYDSNPLSNSNSTVNCECLSSDYISSLPAGWNNIGTPCDIDKSQFDTLFSSARLVWVWDNDKKLWKFWSPDETLRNKASLYGIKPLEKVDKFSAIWIFKH
jgi:hypothetical protein